MADAVNVGYYDTRAEAGAANELDEIVELGQTAVNVTNLTPEVLATLRVLVIQNPFNGGYSDALLAALPAIQAAVANGLVVLFFDRYVDGAEILFGEGNTLNIVRDTDDPGSQQMNLDRKSVV